MNIRQSAKTWLQTHHPDKLGDKLRASKFYPDEQLWFFTFPSEFFSANGNLIILLQKEDNCADFYFLHVPFNFFAKSKQKLDIRCDGKKFDLHLSANRSRRFNDTRGQGIDFSEFLIKHSKQ